MRSRKENKRKTSVDGDGFMLPKVSNETPQYFFFVVSVDDYEAIQSAAQLSHGYYSAVLQLIDAFRPF